MPCVGTQGAWCTRKLPHWADGIQNSALSTLCTSRPEPGFSGVKSNKLQRILSLGIAINYFKSFEFLGIDVPFVGECSS